MLYGEVLLLFSESAPCWTKDLVSMAGEDGDGLEPLRREGVPDCAGEVYVLTGKGAHAFREEARECFLRNAGNTSGGLSEEPLRDDEVAA